MNGISKILKKQTHLSIITTTCNFCILWSSVEAPHFAFFLNQNQPFPPCRCAAPPSPWQKTPCWSFSPPDRIPPVWCGGSSATDLGGPSVREGSAAPGPASKLPSGTCCVQPHPLPLPPCRPEQASLLQQASQTGPHASVSHLHAVKSKERTVHRTYILTHTSRLKTEKQNTSWGAGVCPLLMFFIPNSLMETATQTGASCSSLASPCFSHSVSFARLVDD